MGRVPTYTIEPMNQDQRIKQMEKTLKYAYKHLDYLVQTCYGTNAETLMSRLYSSINSGELESVANTLSEIRDLIGRIE